MLYWLTRAELGELAGLNIRDWKDWEVDYPIIYREHLLMMRRIRLKRGKGSQQKKWIKRKAVKEAGG